MYTNCSRLVPIGKIWGVLSNLSSSPRQKRLGHRYCVGICSLLMLTSTCATSNCHSSSSSSSSSRRTFDACPEIACSESKTKASSGTFDEDLTRKRKRMSPDSSSSIASSIKTTSENDDVVDCPDNRETLGMHTWHFLHSVAAYYPIKANDEEKLAAVGLLFGVAQLYPCSHCRAAFAADMEAHPPTLDSRDEFSIWLCERHNSVNQSLGKPSFPCVASILNERWRSGGGKCSQGVKEAFE